MNIDEFIEHAKEKAKEHRYHADFFESDNPMRTACTRSAEDCEQLADCLTKFKDYQQLEEQGRLIKIPCKVGDTVYRIIDGMIQEFEINKFVVSYSIFNNEATVYMYFAGGHGGCSIDFYGVSVFGTQTEAEAKLKELRGEQNDRE